MGGISVSSLGSIDWCQKSLNIIFFITLLVRTIFYIGRQWRFDTKTGSDANAYACSAPNIKGRACCFPYGA